MVKWPFHRLSDLHPGDEKVTNWITWSQVFCCFLSRRLLILWDFQWWKPQVMESIKAAEEELETAKKEAEDDSLLLLLLCLDGRNPANQLRLVVYPENFQDFIHPWVVQEFWTINSISVSPTSSLNLQDQKGTLSVKSPIKNPAATWQLPSRSWKRAMPPECWMIIGRGLQGDVCGGRNLWVFCCWKDTTVLIMDPE